MLTPETMRLVLTSLQSLATTQAANLHHTEATIAVLVHALEPARLLTTAEKVTRLPIAEQATFRVIWRGHYCFLGNTLLFRLFTRLLLSPNTYVSHDDLLDEVWKGERQGSTIRGIVKRLRDRLRKANMADLANSIDGSVTGHCGLMGV